MARLAPLLGEGDDTVDIEAGGALRVDREAERFEPGERAGLAGDPRGARIGFLAALGPRRPTVVLDQLVEPRREPPLRSHLGIDLPERARAAVPRVGIHRQAQRLPFGVDSRELGFRHEDLASGVEARGFPEAGRDHRDRAEVGGHVLTRGSIAARRALDEAAPLVAQRDGEPVDLELRHVLEVFGRLGRCGQPEAAPHPGIERPELVVAEGVREREHRSPMPDLRERAARRHPDLLGRRVRGDQGREGGLERDQLPQERVVLGVGDLGRVVEVVALVRAAQRLRELAVATRGRLGVERRRGVHEIAIDRQSLGRGSFSRCRWIGDVGHRSKDTERCMAGVRRIQDGHDPLLPDGSGLQPMSSRPASEARRIFLPIWGSRNATVTSSSLRVSVAVMALARDDRPLWARRRRSQAAGAPLFRGGLVGGLVVPGLDPPPERARSRSVGECVALRRQISRGLE